MSDINIEVESGKSKKLLTGGKYCENDIVVTATGTTDPFYNDYWNTLMPTETSLKESVLANAKIINKKVFRPNKNIILSNSANGVFRDMNSTAYGLVDVPALCEELGIYIDYSNNINFTYMHRNNTLFERLGVVDCSKAQILNGCFQLMLNLHTIDKWIVVKGVMTGSSSNLFTSCKALQNLTVEGVIDFNINMQDTDLTAVSAISVLLALDNLTGTENEFLRTVTLNETIWTRITESGITPPSGSSWEDYAQLKGWNI